MTAQDQQTMRSWQRKFAAYWTNALDRDHGSKERFYEQMSKATGRSITASTCHRWLKGKGARGEGAVLPALARAMGTSVEWLGSENSPDWPPPATALPGEWVGEASDPIQPRYQDLLRACADPGWADYLLDALALARRAQGLPKLPTGGALRPVP